MAANRFTEPQRLDQRAEALRLRTMGESYRKIAKALDISPKLAFDRVQEAYDAKVPHPDYEKYQAVQLAELGLARIPVMHTIASWTPGGSVAIADVRACISSLISIQDQEAKLLGLYNAITPVDELSGMSDEALERMVAEWSNDPVPPKKRAPRKSAKPKAKAKAKANADGEGEG